MNSDSFHPEAVSSRKHLRRHQMPCVLTACSRLSGSEDGRHWLGPWSGEQSGFRGRRAWEHPPLQPPPHRAGAPNSWDDAHPLSSAFAAPPPSLPPEVLQTPLSSSFHQIRTSLHPPHSLLTLRLQRQVLLGRRSSPTASKPDAAQTCASGGWAGCGVPVRRNRTRHGERYDSLPRATTQPRAPAPQRGLSPPLRGGV